MKYIHDGNNFVMFLAVDGSHQNIANKIGSQMDFVPQHAGFVTFGRNKRIWIDGESVTLKLKSSQFDIKEDELWVGEDADKFNFFFLSNKKEILEAVGIPDSKIYPAQWILGQESRFDDPVEYLGPPVDKVAPILAQFINMS